MSAVPTGIPPQIEEQLLVLDRQIRDAAFIRGAGRSVFGVSLYLAMGLLLDGLFGLNGTIRGILLATWILLGLGLVWRNVIRPIYAPVSFASLAALVERQFPELRERLTSLVELRGGDGTELAPGASKLMQDLLARQTVRAFNQLSIEEISFHQAPFRALLSAAVAIVLLIAPFAWNASGYSLLLGRFLVPWGNFSWGARLELSVVEGDQVVARGSDVPVHVSVKPRGGGRLVDPEKVSPLRLNWRDVANSSDQRRLVWDAETSTFVTTLPHVEQSLTFDVSTDGARTGSYRIDVADPPTLTKFELEIEPPAYTGLPARFLASVPPEVITPEFSRVLVTVEFNEPVVEARLLWPTLSNEPTDPLTRTHQKPAGVSSISIELSPDRTQGTAEVVASVTGAIEVRATNSSGLSNAERTRMLFVARDQPPEISLDSGEKPLFVRPDDRFELSVEVRDDFGLSAVELHVETSTGIQQLEALPPERLTELPVEQTFTIDLAPLNLTGGQIVTYRIRAADNRTLPASQLTPGPQVTLGPQETWTAPRTLMVNTSLPQLPDQELAAEKQRLEDNLVSLRAELHDLKEAMSVLHQRTEKESLGREPESDKTEQLESQQNDLDSLLERLQELGDLLAERRLTQELALQADQIADEELKVAQERLEQAKSKPSRDQLEPLAQAIDRVGAADKKLQVLDRQLNELNKLEQDLADLPRLAQRAERLAEELEKLNQQREESKHLPDDLSAAKGQESPTAANSTTESNPTKAGDSEKSVADAGSPDEARFEKDRSPLSSDARPDADERSGKTEAASNPPNRGDDSAAADERLSNARTRREADSETLRRLKEEGEKLSQQMDELLKKHPELIDAARRDKQDQLSELGAQAKQLAERQSRLAETLAREAESSPASASQPENLQTESASSEESKAQANSVNKGASSPAAEKDEAVENIAKSSAESDSGDQSRAENPFRSTAPGREASLQQDRSDEAVPPRTKLPSSTLQERGKEALQRQEQLMRDATQQAVELARETGADAPVTKSAADFARKADLARQQLQAGQLADAVETSRQAEQAAEETRQHLNPDGQSKSSRSQQAEQLAQQQREAKSELEKLAPSAEAVRGAQMQGQRQLADAAKKLTEKLDEASRSLKSTPINRLPASAEAAESGQKAREAIKQAEEAMKDSERANSRQEPTPSARAAADAAEKLQKAASEVMPTAPQATQSTGARPIPKQLGAKVADATRQIKSAQEKLGQCQCPDSENSSGSKPGNATSPVPSSSSSEAGSTEKGREQQASNPSGPVGSGGQSTQARSEPESKPSKSSNSPGKQSSEETAKQGQSDRQSGEGGKAGGRSEGQMISTGTAESSAERVSKTPQLDSDKSKAAPATSRSEGLAKSEQQADPKKNPADGSTSPESAEESELASAAQQFRQFAKLLKSGGGTSKGQEQTARTRNRPSLSQSLRGDSPPPGGSKESGESGESGEGATATADLSHLEIELQQQARQNWGRLPGQLRTEILQGAGKKSHPEYTERIKSYFDEITRPAR